MTVPNRPAGDLAPALEAILFVADRALDERELPSW